jgi:hypothetical protein
LSCDCLSFKQSINPSHDRRGSTCGYTVVAPKCHPESSSQVSKNKPQTYVQSTNQKHQNISMRTQQTSQILEMHPWYPFFASREGFGWRPFDIFKVCGLKASGRKHGTRHTVTPGFNKHDKYKGYPLVNTQKTMENPLYSWVNKLLLWPCSVAMLVYQRVSHQQKWGLHCNLTLQNEDLISRRLDRCCFSFSEIVSRKFLPSRRPYVSQSQSQYLRRWPRTEDFVTSKKYR